MGGGGVQIPSAAPSRSGLALLFFFWGGGGGVVLSPQRWAGKP